MSGIAGTGLAISSLAGGNAYAEGEIIDASIKTEDATCALGTFAMDFSIDGLRSNAGDQSKAPSNLQTSEPNVAVIKTPVEMFNYTDRPAKFIIKSITNSSEYGRNVTRNVVRVKDGDFKDTNVYTATPLNTDSTYKIKVNAKGLGLVNTTENIPVSETCE